MDNKYLDQSENGFVTLDAINLLKREIEIKRENNNDKILDFLNHSIKCLEKGLELEKSSKRVLNITSLIISLALLITQAVLFYNGLVSLAHFLTIIHIFPISFIIKAQHNYIKISNAINDTLDFATLEKEKLKNEKSTTKQKNNDITKEETSKKLDELNDKMIKVYSEGYYSDRKNIKKRILRKPNNP